ncbi:OmpA family protein [Mucilaginibacter sp. HMF5004]|uniref:OmpA family protein n=1 Tax=Mucilaginibacter rivuli TaxID=2857527 RepID=UPI001C6020DE|nr:OmpA family protein [Mucilaginibacter rivuli]MBW4889912.1 OmpA family protein [Mucilaginibacter rivuli]
MKLRLRIFLCLSIFSMAANAQVTSLRDTMQHDTLVKRYILAKPKATQDTASAHKTGAARQDTITAYRTIPQDLVWHDLKAVKLKAINRIQDFRTWNIGINTGILSPFLVIGGSNNFTNVSIKQGFGISVRKQLIHSVGFQFDALTGHVAGSNPPYYKGNASIVQSFNTNLAYSLSLTSIIQIGSLDIFKHRNALNFFVLAGSGFIGFAPTVNYVDGTTVSYEGHVGFTRDKTFVHELTTQAGIGLKIRINDRFTFNSGYTANFVDDDFFDGTYGNTFNLGEVGKTLSSTNFARSSRKNKFSYGYFGLEMSIGKKSKPNIDWVSSMPSVYERVKDSVRVDSTLKTRLLSFQHKIDSLKNDEDGDGVPDYFDKCLHTPKGTTVDGSGCPIVIVNKPDSALLARLNKLDTMAKTIVYPIVMFDYNSSTIPSSYYQQLDVVVKDLIAHPAKKVTIRGYASSEGIVGHNISLSVARARAVKMYLVANGVPEAQVTAKGYGEMDPRANNSSEQGRIINRRAVFE